MRGALKYNEQKVATGKAECIQANLFQREVHALTFNQKLNRFNQLIERNRRTKTNTLHISLNFDTSERLSIDELNRIATTYMEKIGFGDQPYLVYQHHDAAHPHIHILTTLIQENGKRISIHYLGKNQSEKARKEIEKEFQLVQASSKSKNDDPDIRAIDLEKILYGKSESRRSVSNVVRTVVRSYKYSSLPELNAALGLYNVRAERGHETSKMFDRKGLLYSIVDSKGNSIGVPVKASAIYGKPTLGFLEKQFRLNEVLKQPHRNRIKDTIDRVIQSGVTDKNELITELSKKGLIALLRHNNEGRIYGVTFIDTKHQVVFKGSDLGKAYSANFLLSRIEENKEAAKPFRPGFSPGTTSSDKNPSKPSGSFQSLEILKGIITAEDNDRSSPEAALRLGRKRRKRKGRGL